MKLFTPEISWHEKEPVFAVDFCPETWKLASCGGDMTIKIWMVKEDGEGNIGLDFLSNLDRHSKPVNVVRFSPNGKMLASAGDDGAIILWKLNENERSCPDIFGSDDIENKEHWTPYKMLRGHIEDIYDLAWSPDSNQLITGSVDNSAIIWDATKGQSQKILTDHKHYVQGVCWDPVGSYVATHSSDRSCRLYSSATHKCLHNIHKNNSCYMKNGQMKKTKLSRMFMDETMQSFFRRCTFSPDGSFLILPAGLCEKGEDEKPQKTTYVFARGRYGRPHHQLIGPKKATVAVKFSPVVYELMEDKENQPKNPKKEPFKVPYRMVYAVASLDAVTFYDTQHSQPIGHIGNMHYASLTDVTWSSDGSLVVISSMDGYCSFVKFDGKELGTPISFDALEYQITQAKILNASKKEKLKSEKEKLKMEKEKLKQAEKEKLRAEKERIKVEKERLKAEKKEASKKEKADDESEKTDTSSSNDSKEKQTPVLAKNQPTIDKLFVTPIRKRKRQQTSPGSTPLSGGKDNTPSSGLVSPLVSPSNKTVILEKKSSPLVSHSSLSSNTMLQKSPQKPPKRVQVITLSSPEKPFSSKGMSSKSPIKMRQPFLQKPQDVPCTFKQTQSKPSTDSGGSTSSSPQVKPPKRVNTTMLCSFSDSGAEAKSSKLPTLVQIPTKVPKRVQVTTLVDASAPSTHSGSNLETPKTLREDQSNTTGLNDKITSTVDAKEKIVTPILGNKTEEASVENKAKKPRRVSLVTLWTAKEEEKSKSQKEINISSKKASDGPTSSTTSSKDSSDKNSKDITTIVLD